MNIKKLIWDTNYWFDSLEEPKRGLIFISFCFLTLILPFMLGLNAFIPLLFFWFIFSSSRVVYVFCMRKIKSKE